MIVPAMNLNLNSPKWGCFAQNLLLLKLAKVAPFGYVIFVGENLIFFFVLFVQYTSVIVFTDLIRLEISQFTIEYTTMDTCPNNLI